MGQWLGRWFRGEGGAVGGGEDDVHFRGEGGAVGGGEDDVHFRGEGGAVGGGEDDVDAKYEQLQPQKVSLQQLYSMAGRTNVVRAGSTNDPDRRRREYVYKKGYSGTMYYAHTSTMTASENRLLENQHRDNEQTSSNQSEGPGYVYLIQT